MRANEKQNKGNDAALTSSFDFIIENKDIEANNINSLESNFVNVSINGENIKFYDATNYLYVRIIGGEYSKLIDRVIDERKAMAVQFQSKIGFKKSYTILKDNALGDDKDLILQLKKKLKSIARLENDDWEKVLDSINYLDRESIFTEVPSLDAYIKDEMGSDDDRKNYSSLCQFVESNMNLFAYKSKNDYKEDYHYGTWLDTNRNIRDNNKIYLAIKSDSLYRNIFLKTKPVEDENQNKAYNAYKYSLKNLGVVKWYVSGREGCTEQTLGRNKKAWCLLVEITGRSKVDGEGV